MQLLANGKQQFIDQNGAPLAGGTVYHYLPSTTTPVTTYRDQAGQAANTNPILLDSRGQAVIWGTGSFRQIVKDAQGVTVWDQVISASINAADLGAPDGVSLVGNAVDTRELAQSSGASSVGYQQITVDARLKQSVSIQDFGGKDDYGQPNPTDNAIALAKVTAAYPNGCTIRFPKTGTTQYDFLSYGSGNLNNYAYDVEEGVTLRFPVNAMMGQNLSRWVRDTVCYFKDLNTFYTMKSSFSNTGQHRYHLHKTQFLGPGDRDGTLLSAIDLAAPNVEKFDCAWPNGPFAISTAITITSSRKADIALAAGNAKFSALALPAIPGTEYSFWYSAPAGWDGVFVFGVATQNGYDVLYEAAVPGTGASRMVEEFGTAYVNSNIPFLGSGDHYSTWAANGICTVRCLAYNQFVVLVNGVERYRSRATNSAIKSVLLGAGFGSMAATISVRDVVLVKNKQTAGQKPLNIMAIGDSITDQQIHGNWPNFMCEALEGTMGIRVRQMNNIAVSGAKANDQYATLLTADISNVDVAVILIGVNDIQAQTDPDNAFIANFGAILDRFNSYGIPCVVGVPTMFFSRALASGVTGFAAQGVDSSNYEKGAPYRGRLIYEVANRNPTLNRICFGTLEDLGPVLATWLADIQGLDSVVVDNIHPTSHARRLMGYAMARSVAGMLAPTIARSYPRTSFQPGWMSNSWTINTGCYDISESGEVSLTGLINANGGPIVDGTVVFTLPPFLRPMTTIQVPCLVTGAAYSASVRLMIDANSGQGMIYGAPAGVTGLYLDVLQYRLNW